MDWRIRTIQVHPAELLDAHYAAGWHKLHALVEVFGAGHRIAEHAFTLHASEPFYGWALRGTARNQ